MREPIYRPRAVRDIESTIIYQGGVLKAPAAARKTYTDLVEAVAKLCDMPTMGYRFEDERLEHGDFRVWHVGHYRIFYTYDKSTLTIWRVLHDKQNLSDYAIVDWE